MNRLQIRITQSSRGWDVQEFYPDSPDSSGPMSSYPNAALAAARVLQLLELTQPISPQTWPEDVCIGFINTNRDQP